MQLDSFVEENGKLFTGKMIGYQATGKCISLYEGGYGLLVLELRWHDR